VRDGLLHDLDTTISGTDQIAPELRIAPLVEPATVTQ
jgi:hypothetical protein